MTQREKILKFCQLLMISWGGKTSPQDNAYIKGILLKTRTFNGKFTSSPVLLAKLSDERSQDQGWNVWQKDAGSTDVNQINQPIKKS